MQVKSIYAEEARLFEQERTSFLSLLSIFYASCNILYDAFEKTF